MEPEKSYIYQIYLDGSFSRAAEHLYMSQPALSLSVKKTEDALGVHLFDRSHRPLRLTQAGEAYIASLKEIMETERDIGRKIADIRDAEAGLIRIGGTHFLNAYILPEVLSGFCSLHPRVEIELAEYGAGRLAEMLATKDIDLTLNCNPAVIPLYEHYPAFRDSVVLAVHRLHPLNAGLESAAFTARDILAGKHLKPGRKAVPISCFGEMEFLLLAPGNNLRERCLAMFGEAGLEPRTRATLTQMVTAYRLAQSNYAPAFVSDRLVKEEDSELLFYVVRSDQVHRLFYLLLPQRSYTPAAVRAFVRYAQQAFKGKENRA